MASNIASGGLITVIGKAGAKAIASSPATKKAHETLEDASPWLNKEEPKRAQNNELPDEPVNGGVERPTDPYDPNWVEYNKRNPDSPKGVGADRVLQAQEFEKSISRLPPGERVAQVRQKAKEVADNLGWVKDKKITRLNGRDVYRGNDGNLYSVDTQHGRFEKVNPKNGKHMGEVDIDLNPIDGKVDNSGWHDLKVK